MDIEQFGDLIIARKDISTSYHLSVTIDDNSDGITHIIRGNDLLQYTHIPVSYTHLTLPTILLV